LYVAAPAKSDGLLDQGNRVKKQVTNV
jgi:hypothetical protein